MSRSSRARPIAAVLTVLLLAAACGALEEPDSGWTVDEEAVAERLAADELAAARERVAAVVRRVGSLSTDHAECVVATALDDRPDTATLGLADVEVDSSALRGPLADALAACGLVSTVAETWVPELAVDLTGEQAAMACVGDAAGPWSADRFAGVVAAGGFAEEEDPVDHDWLGRIVDGCDAGAAMMAATATVSPQVGAEARTPSRWLCAAAAAPAGAFDDLLDPAVVADEARLQAVESRIDVHFRDCA